MKKLCTLLLAALLLTACGSHPAVINSDYSSGSSSSAQNDKVQSHKKLTLLSGYDGKGFYSFESTDAATSLPYLAYTDLEAAIQAPLCSAPSCAHNTTDCTAIFSTIGEIYSYNGKLIFYSRGYNSGYDSNSVDGTVLEAPSIIMADATGGNRKVLGHLYQEIFDLLPTACYGEELLFFTNTDNGLLLNEINLTTGRVGQISKEPLSGSCHFLGVYENNYVFYSFDYGAEKTSFSVFLLSADDASINTIAEISRPAGSDIVDDFIYANGKTYHLQSSPLQEFDVINTIDCKTGETALLTNEIKNQSGIQELGNIIDDTLIIYSPQGREDQTLPDCRNFTYNVKTKEQGELTLFVHNPVENYISPLTIFREVGDYFVVLQKIEYARKIFNGTGGIPYEVDTTNDTFALISRADYLSSTPNFKAITKMEVK